MYPNSNQEVSALNSAPDPECRSALEERWILVHDGYRDHYELPVALAEAGMLECFVTDWYTPMEKPLWRQISRSRLGRSSLGLRNRFRTELPSSLTKDQKMRFLFSLVRRKLLHTPFRDEIEGAKAGKMAARLASRRRVPLLATSYSASAAFANLRPGLLRVLFQIHPHPRSLQRLYQQTMTADPDYGGLRLEPEATVGPSELERWEQESKQADYVVCASRFTRATLEEAGVPSERIAVLPYGVDTALFQAGRPERDSPFTALFVGQKVARKGLRMLLHAWKELSPRDARLVLAGGHVRDAAELEGFQGCYEEVPRTTLADLIRLYQSADVFVLPSLAEGFGHVYLEALACGTPIICTENTGAADIISSGESGWVLPVGDRGSLRERLEWCISHRAELGAMRAAARATAERYSWARFRKTLRALLQSARIEAPPVP